MRGKMVRIGEFIRTLAGSLEQGEVKKEGEGPE